MATEKLRAELELITKKAEADLERFDRKLSKVDSKVRDLGSKGGKALRPLGTGLSNATANASEFEKSMAAANARVIAFGASAGLVLQISRALKETVKATIEVEKALADINIVLNANTAGLQKFGNQLFKIAAQTGQSFKVVATGATELARQGLATEQTLKRLNDAMILSRLTGMGAEEAVKNLTAAVNSFNKTGITSAQVINKMAKVDQAFAVSSDDLAKAISRVGSSAVDAGVSMDELMAITTAVQQRTARGGAVIGNAFKTIFTRIQRTDVQKKLAAIGVATRDMQGNMLGATKVLQNLSDKFKDLSKTQQNQMAESVAGVFQVNILRSALGDLSNKYGIYNRALKESATATDQAYQKNEKLNQTLDALVNKSLVNLTQAGAAIGGATLEPAITRVLNLVNGAIGAFQEGGMFEEFGKGLGKDLLKGLGSFISGPGLVLITVGISKLMINFASFAKTALMGILELNKGALARKGIEDSVTASLMQQPGIIKQIEAGEISAATAAKDMLATMRAQNMQADKLRITTAAIAGQMMGMGARGGRGGGRPGRASGFIPNFANADGERAAAAMGGYRAGGIKSMSIPGQGSVMYNGAETVKRFPGFTQPAIMPPKKSLAGTNYKSAFGAAHGFDPYAGSGFVPNFSQIDLEKNIFPSRPNRNIGGRLSLYAALQSYDKGSLSRSQLSQAYGKKTIDATTLGKKSEGGAPVRKPRDIIKESVDVQGRLGVISLYGKHTGVLPKTASMKIGDLAAFKGSTLLKNNPNAAKERIQFRNVQVGTMLGLEKDLAKKKDARFSDLINKSLIGPLANIGAQLIGKRLGNQTDSVGHIKDKMQSSGRSLLPKQAEGELFETALKLALHKPRRFMQSITGSPTAPFDFEETKPPTSDFVNSFGFGRGLLRADAKRSANKADIDSVVKKAYNQHVLIEQELLKNPAAALNPVLGVGTPLPLAGTINQEAAFGRLKGTASPSLRGRPGGAHGFIPNYSPLGDALGRERAAGVPRSAIRIGSSSTLASSANPGGLGVYNTIDEPRGLGQGISRSKRMGINPKSHGAFAGLVPNFIDAPTEYVPKGSSSRASSWSPGAPTATEVMRERTSGTKLESSSKSIASSAKDMKVAAGSMEGAAGKMFMLSTVGYMAAGPIMQGMDLDPGTQSGVNSVMMKGMAAAMLGSQLGVGATGLKGLGGGIAKGFQSMGGGFGGGRGAMGALERRAMLGKSGVAGSGGRSIFEKAWGATKGAGRQLVGLDPVAKKGGPKLGLKGGAKAAGKGAMKLGAKALPIAGWAWAGYDIVKGAMGGWKETPEEKAARENAENLQTMKEEDYRPVLEQLGSSVLGMGGNFGMSTPKARASQYENVKKLMYGEGGVMDRAKPEERKTLQGEFREFTASFAQGATAVETAGVKFNKAIIGVAESIGDAITDAENKEKRQKIYGSFSPGGKFKREMEEVEKERWVTRDVGMPGREGSAATVRRRTKEKYTVQEETERSKKRRQAELVSKLMTMGGERSLVEGRIVKDIKAQKAAREEGLKAKERYEKMTPEQREKVYGADFDPATSGPGGGPVQWGAPKGLGDPEAFLKGMDLWDDKGKITKGGRGALSKYWNLGSEDINLLEQLGKKDPALMQRVEKEILSKEKGHTPDLEGLGILLGSQTVDMGPKQTSTLGWRVSAADTRKKMSEDNAAFEATRAQVKILQSKNAKDREYQDALGIVTRGLYGEGDIKLRETKQKLQEAYEREIALSGKKVDDAASAFSAGMDEITAAALSKVNDPERQQLILDAIERARVLDEDKLTIRKGEIASELEDVGADPDPTKRLILAAEKKAIDLRLKENKVINDQFEIVQTANNERETGIEVAKTDNKISRAMVDSKFQYKRVLDLQTKAGEAQLAKEKAAFGKGDLDAGRITGSNYAALQRAKRARARDAGGLKGQWIEGKDGQREWVPGASTASIGTIFKEEWAYGPRSQTEEFEDGMADVARTVKSSLKTAIKDIVSGAESFEDGMYRVFAALADKLADQGISMGVNSLFGMFGGSKGGMVPRGYNKGGMVRGGSGVRDDVLTYMQGGEYVIRKSAVNNIPGGEATLNAINGGNARGGLIPSYPTGGKANVSLAKEFLFNDPKRPTSGGYNISGALSTSALFRDDDPQTANTIGKQAKFVQYQDYRRREQERRDKIIEDIERQKKGRLYNAYLSAALRVGAGALSKAAPTPAPAGGGAARPQIPSSQYGSHYGTDAGAVETGDVWPDYSFRGSADPWGGAVGGYVPGFASGGPARVMGGEYIMSAGATAHHGTAFMSQLNRGRLPGFQEGGLVGGSAAMAAGITTNNVNLSINIDKSGGAEVTAEKSGRDRSKNDERSTSEEAEDSKKLAEGIRNAVIKEIITQQRPGGLLRDGASASRLRQP